MKTTNAEWYSTPSAKRHRKPIEITLGVEARDRLDRMAERQDRPRSRVIEDLILEAPIVKKGDGK